MLVTGRHLLARGARQRHAAGCSAGGSSCLAAGDAAGCLQRVQRIAVECVSSVPALCCRRCSSRAVSRLAGQETQAASSRAAAGELRLLLGHGQGDVHILPVHRQKGGAGARSTAGPVLLSLLCCVAFCGGRRGPSRLTGILRM